jgi:uncharacterized protein YecE (DUF72 family)
MRERLAAKESQAIHIGTSGWHYDHWVGPFYPPDLATGDFLAYYAQHFCTVEINSSFYGLPEVESLQRWREATPPGFLFAVKASQYITHMKKLRDPQEPVLNLLERIEPLGQKLGPILFQLPPNWHLNVERLNLFLQAMPQGYRYAFEFRDPSWLEPRTYEVLRQYGAAFCIYDLAGQLAPKEITADWIYVRLHGPNGAYQGDYDVQTLSGWAGAFSTWAAQGKEIYCYFDNDQFGYAVKNALRLQAMF